MEVELCDIRAELMILGTLGFRSLWRFYIPDAFRFSPMVARLLPLAKERCFGIKFTRPSQFKCEVRKWVYRVLVISVSI